MSAVKVGQQVEFTCVPLRGHDCNETHNGEVTTVTDITPTLSIVEFVDQHGQSMAVAAADVRVVTA